MSVPERLNANTLGRPHANPIWRGLDPDAFKLHVKFMHSHGLPRGELTTLSGPGITGTTTHLRRDGAHRR